MASEATRNGAAGSCVCVPTIDAAAQGAVRCDTMLLGVLCIPPGQTQTKRLQDKAAATLMGCDGFYDVQQQNLTVIADDCVKSTSVAKT